MQYTRKRSEDPQPLDKGCPQLVIEESFHYYPKRRTFLSREVEAIVKHLGEP